MSAKWRRIQARDRATLTGPLTPVRWVLWALSSITLAIVTLVFIALYAVLASVPLGLLALGVTYAFYVVTVLVPVACAVGAGVWVIRRLLAGSGKGLRSAATIVVGAGAGVLAAFAWSRLVWPSLQYDPVAGTGVRFFTEIVRDYGSVTIRRLPGFEMTELEFYSWWPMRLALLVFVLNMVVATVRRIEFNFKNLGVLTVHTGIVLIALGSVFYQGFKLEGDTLVLAGPEPGFDGPAQGSFHDNTRIALFASQSTPGEETWDGRPRWEQRLLARIPRYNDYALGAGTEAGESLWAMLGLADPGARQARETLDRAVPEFSGPPEMRSVDADLVFRVVGYAHYADLHEDWVRVDPADDPEAQRAGRTRPLRIYDLSADLPPEAMTGLSAVIGREVSPGETLFRFTMLPTLPDQRVRENQILAIEHLWHAEDARWRDLSEPVPPGVNHALVVEIARDDAPAIRVAVPARVGEAHELAGYVIGVKALHPTPPFPIVTPGYEGATSSVAVVEVTTPEGEVFDRWIYHRFPELNQDFAGGTPDEGSPGAGGMGVRTKSDESVVRLAYLDASRIQVFLDERTGGGVRAIVRQPGGSVRTVESLDGARLQDIIPGIDLSRSQSWAHARALERPVPTPEPDQDKRFVGTHDKAALAVEVSRASDTGPDGWSEVVWLPFSKYVGVGAEQPRKVTLPDGREITLAFGRLQHQFPDFRVRMVDFEMISYDHRGAPRDYQSVVRVEPRSIFDDSFEPFEHVVKLNAPLRAPFHWNDDAPWVSNAAKRLASGLNPRQFKLSQAGWDQQGWQQSQAQVDAGLIERPRVSFTILHVGNNPGIHVIALGGVLMALGIPWAFYVKPWLVRRERDRLRAQHARTDRADVAKPARTSRAHKEVIQEVGA